MVAIKNTLIIIVWFGDWPAYLPYFIKTIEHNPNFNWLLVSDKPELPNFPDNLELKHISIQDFNELASEKLGLPVNIIDPRKLCDFKPAYGMIFKDYLKEYDYWGYCDLDLIFGNLGRYLNPLFDKETEVISFYRDYLSGPFCLYRKSDKTMGLYRKISDYQNIFTDPAHYAMDENNKYRMPELSSFATPGIKIRYLLAGFISLNIFRLSLKEIRYRYQWFLKKSVNPLHPPFDMTDVVTDQSNKRELSVSFQDWILSDRAFRRAGRKRWEINWKDGILTERHDNREVPVFHYIDLKNRLKGTDTDPTQIPIKFTLDPDGFHHE